VRVRDVFIFICHQLLGAWGIAFLAAFGLFSLFDMMPDSFGLKPSLQIVHWLLTENPFYPVQIITGLYFGWFIAHRFPHRSMLFVWILPLLFLAYSFLAGPVLSPWASTLIRPESLSGRVRFYFGWGCQPRDRCMDRLLLTMPLYASLAYSAGGLLAGNIPAKACTVTEAIGATPLRGPD